MKKIDTIQDWDRMWGNGCFQMFLVQSLWTMTWDILLKLKFHRSDQQPIIMNLYFRKIYVYIGLWVISLYIYSSIGWEQVIGYCVVSYFICQIKQENVCMHLHVHVCMCARVCMRAPVLVRADAASNTWRGGKGETLARRWFELRDGLWQDTRFPLARCCFSGASVLP